MEEASIRNTSVSDQVAAKDSLGFEPYVKAIAEFLTNPQTKPPLTLSVEGEWGSGKSSFMKQLQGEIKEKSQKQLKENLTGIEKSIRRFLLQIFYVLPQNLELYNPLLRFLWLLLVIVPSRILLFMFDSILSLLFKGLKWLLPRFIRQPRTVWFNAWRHDKAEALWAAFALEFIRQISNIRGIADIFPILWGHLSLFFCRIQWTVDALLDALKTIAQLLLGIAAIAIILIFSLGQRSDWVVKLSEIVEDLNTVIQGSDQPKKDTTTSTTSKPNQSNQSKQSSQNKNNSSQSALKEEDSTNNPTDNLFSWAASAAGIGGSSLIVVSLWKQLKKMVGDPKKELAQYLNSPNYQSQVAFVEKFHQDFKKIVDAYVGNDKVYVFIDDLDRCELPKSAELMQALNLMITEDPSIIFILGMDREKIAASLAVKYQELLPYLLSESNFNDEEIDSSRSFQKGLEYGYGFIEKFVQLPFLVPQPADADLDFFLQTIATPTPARPSLIRHSWQASQQLIQAIPQRWKQIQEFIFRRRQKPESTPETTIPTPPTTSPTQERTEERKLERRQRIKLQVTEDSTVIRRITSMVASALDYNPRRLKQFINLFRLRTYIASDTGLFDEWVDTANNAPVNRPLTLEQLAKFVAINLKWPLLLTDLENDFNLLENLENFSLPHSANDNQYDKTTKYWGSRQKLKELIGYGLDQTIRNKYSLAAVEVEKLLQVSPQGGRRRDNTRWFTEELGGNVTLEMLAIPEGKFMMGSPENESGRSDRESPQHEVTVPPFFMSQYPITQGQWREIASLPPVKRYLNPTPSFFKGDERPVEFVSWDDAVEFCARLSKLSEREYRLPTEAEWEYACRAGTTTTYYFGENITDQLANYDENVGKTTPVGKYPPNAFGLYDMHGNVWEWCQDDWHENYQGAPIDGSAWVAYNMGTKVLRGGSWHNQPEICRSAFRSYDDRRGLRNLDVSGFRVVWGFGRT